MGQVPEAPQASVELPPPGGAPKKAEAPAPLPTPTEPAAPGDPKDTLPALDVAPAPAPEPLPVPKEKPADAPPAFPPAADSPPALPALEDPKPKSPPAPIEMPRPTAPAEEPAPRPAPAPAEKAAAPAPTEAPAPGPEAEAPAAKPDAGGPTVKVYRLSYVQASDLAPMVSPFLSKEGTLSVRPAKPDASEAAKAEAGAQAQADSLIVRDTPDRLAQVDEIVRQVDIPPAQVLVEAVVLSVPVDGRRQLGINFGPIDKAPGFRAADAPPAQAGDGQGGRIISGNLSPEMGAKFGFIDVNAAGIVRDMKAGRKINVLASPRLVVLDRQWAAVQFGRRMGYEPNGSALPSTLQAVQFLSVETLMNLRPVVSKDGMVRLEIKLANGKDVATADASTSFLVSDGETIVVGGLGETPEPTPPSQASAGLLGFPRRPLIANAGRDRAGRSAKSELVVLLTPRVMGRTTPKAEPAPEPAQVAAQPRTPDVHPAPEPPPARPPSPSLPADLTAAPKPEPRPEPAAPAQPPSPGPAEVAVKEEKKAEPEPRPGPTVAQATPGESRVPRSRPTPATLLTATANPEPPVAQAAPDEPPASDPEEVKAEARKTDGSKVADYRWMGSARPPRERPRWVDEPVRRVTLTIPPMNPVGATAAEPARVARVPKPHVHAMDLPRAPEVTPEPERELPITVSAAPIDPSGGVKPAMARKPADGVASARPGYRPGDLTRGVLGRMRSRSTARQQEAPGETAAPAEVARAKAPRGEPGATDNPERPEHLTSYSVASASERESAKAPAAAPARPSPLSDPRGGVIYRWHTVAKGEDFGTLAKGLYGSASLRGALWKVNRHLVDNPDDLRPGTMILLPPPEVMDRIVLDTAMSATDEEDARPVGSPRRGTGAAARP